MSALSLRYINVGSPSMFNLSSYDKFDISLTNLVALLCIFSIATMSFFKVGDQITDAYSKVGLTKDLYNVKNISLSIYSSAEELIRLYRSHQQQGVRWT